MRCHRHLIDQLTEDADTPEGRDSMLSKAKEMLPNKSYHQTVTSIAHQTHYKYATDHKTNTNLTAFIPFASSQSLLNQILDSFAIIIFYIVNTWGLYAVLKANSTTLQCRVRGEDSTSGLIGSTTEVFVNHFQCCRSNLIETSLQRTPSSRFAIESLWYFVGC